MFPSHLLAVWNTLGKTGKWEIQVDAIDPVSSVHFPAGGMHAAAATVAIRYLGTPEVTVRGTATGQHYRFSPEAPVQKVSLRDSELLLRSRLFKRG